MLVSFVLCSLSDSLLCKLPWFPLRSKLACRWFRERVLTQCPVHRDGGPWTWLQSYLGHSMGSPSLDQGSCKQLWSTKKVTGQAIYETRDSWFLYKLLMLLKRKELNTWGVSRRGFSTKISPVPCSKAATQGILSQKPPKLKNTYPSKHWIWSCSSRGSWLYGTVVMKTPLKCFNEQEFYLKKTADLNIVLACLSAAEI